ncbi:regulatory signaling modulator protein AmpE [Marinobacter subterrani]|uniref:Membrane protein required for beta-lactamase induction n=1 Tax=Marinobacter subterrani TaxID=1658765 RepID=A0A0J7LYK4_9GAMM|nr:histidine kinase [Marinobacter subterrani]KMQ73975.1 Membrane protein required for beta-lactamase induction [Marinobacter subterrani]
MVLVVFLLAYLVRRRLDSLGLLAGDEIWRRWFRRGSRVRAGHEAEVGKGLALVLLPAFLLGLAEYLLVSSGWQLAAYPLEFLVLVSVMGAPGWRQALRAYAEAWQRGDMQSAWHHIKDYLPARERGQAVSPEVMHLYLTRALMVSVFQRFFLVAFWYVVGGIGLAVLARGLVALADHWPQAPARPRFARISEWAGWIPARLLSLTFGLAGDLAGWLQETRRTLTSVANTAGEVLMISANGSLTGYALDPARFSRIHPEEWPGFGGRSLSAVRDLLNRSMLVWICILALLVISGVV